MTALQATLDCAIVPVFDVWVENSYRRVNADCAGYNGLLFLVGCKIGYFRAEGLCALRLSV